MDTRTLILILTPFVVLNLVLMISAIVSIARKALPWGSKWVWLLVVLLIDFIGPVIYFAVGSNMLEDKAAQLQDAYDANQANHANQANQANPGQGGLS